MTTLALNKWGHSYGVRIPQLVLKQLAIRPGDRLELDMDVVNQQIILKPTAKRKGWLEAFNQSGQTKVTETALDFSNQFDEEEWTW